MRRRILGSMVGLVVLSLVLVGAGTAMVAWTRAASTTERYVADQTRAMAVAFEEAIPFLARTACGPGSAWSARIRTCSTSRSAPTCGTPGPAPPTPSSTTPAGPPASWT